MLSQAYANHFKWRELCQSLMRVQQRFLDSMRELQKVVHHRKTTSDDEISKERHSFETGKKNINKLMIKIQKELDASQSELMRKGAMDFGTMDNKKPGTRKTVMENVGEVRNILGY